MSHVIRWLALLTLSGPAYAVELPALGDSPARVKATCPDAGGLDDAWLLSRTCGRRASAAWLGNPAPKSASLHLFIEHGRVTKVQLTAQFEPLAGAKARAHLVRAFCLEGTGTIGPGCRIAGEARDVWLSRDGSGASVVVVRLGKDEEEYGPPPVPGLEIYLGDALAEVQAACPGRREADRWLPTEACRKAILQPKFSGLPPQTRVSLKLEGDRLVGWRVTGGVPTGRDEPTQMYFQRAFCLDGCDTHRYRQLTTMVDSATSTFDVHATIGPPGSKAR